MNEQDKVLFSNYVKGRYNNLLAPSERFEITQPTTDQAFLDLIKRSSGADLYHEMFNVDGGRVKIGENSEFIYAVLIWECSYQVLELLLTKISPILSLHATEKERVRSYIDSSYYTAKTCHLGRRGQISAHLEATREKYRLLQLIDNPSTQAPDEKAESKAQPTLRDEPPSADPSFAKGSAREALEREEAFLSQPVQIFDLLPPAPQGTPAAGSNAVPDVMRDNIAQAQEARSRMSSGELADKSLPLEAHPTEFSEDGKKTSRRFKFRYLYALKDYFFENRPGRFWLALLVGGILLALCIPHVAPAILSVAVSAYIAKMVIVLGGTAFAAAIAFFGGMLATHLIFITLGALKLGIRVRQALWALEGIVRTAITFALLLTHFFGIVFYTLAKACKKRGGLAYLGALIFIVCSAPFIVPLIAIGIACYISGRVLQVIGKWAGKIFTTPLLQLAGEKLNLDKTEYRTWKAALQWLLVIPLLAFFLIKKIGRVFSDFANGIYLLYLKFKYGSGNVFERSFECSQYTVFRPMLNTAGWENKTLTLLSMNDRALSADDDDTIKDVNFSNPESNGAIPFDKKIILRRGLWAVPVDMAKYTDEGANSYKDEAFVSATLPDPSHTFASG